MNRKELILLLIGVLVIGGAGLLVYRQNASSWQQSNASGGGKVLKEFPANDVAQIQIKSAQSEVNLVKKEDVWTVKERADYPASFDQVSDLVRKLWELKAVQNVKAGPSQFGRLNLNEPGPDAKSPGTLVDLKNAKGERMRGVLFGKTYNRNEGDEGGGFPAGRYLLPLDDAKQVVLVSEPFSQVDNPVAQWLDRSFFKVDRVKALAVTGTSSDASWKITRESESADWKMENLKEGEELDKAKTSAYSTHLSYPAFVDVAAPDAKVENPTTIEVETFEGFTYSIKLGSSNESNIPLKLTVNANFAKERTPAKDEKPEDKDRLDKQFADQAKVLQDKLGREKKLEHRVYLVTKTSFESFFKTRAELLAEKKAPEAASAPAEIK